MDRNDVWMRQSGGGAGFTQKARARRVSGEWRGQRFDRYITVELYVTRQVDNAHAAPAQLSLQ
jgi:hypothetical protein